jgi:tRNA (cmo5U34)-methyltransferase
LEARYKALWLAQVQESGATEQQIRDSLYRQQEDRCVTVAQQLLWMREAGFTDADCWFKDNRFAVMAGTKSA